MELIRRQEEALSKGPANFSQGSYNAKSLRPRDTRLRSPVRRTSYNHRRSRSPEPKKATFQALTNSGAGEYKQSICPICLSRKPHKVSLCNATKLWCSSEAQSTRAPGGRIFNKLGLVLCSDWQKPIRCTDISGKHRHECLGCGKRDHRANGCPRAQA